MTIAESRAIPAVAGQDDTWDGVEFYFPNVKAGLSPAGHKVLIQYKTPKKMTRGGIIMSDAMQEAQQYFTQTAKIIAMGPLAFKDRTTLEPWPEEKAGATMPAVGDFIRTPVHNQDRWKIKFKREGSDIEEEALFGIINDTSVFGTVDRDPKTILAFD